MVKISTRKLCYELLHISKDELLSLAASAELYYKPYDQKKIRKDGSVKIRRIEPPENNSYLKLIQKRINITILQPAIEGLPKGIMGGRKRCSILDNAKLHSHSKALMKYDIQNFFPSIKYRHVYKIFYYDLNFCEEAANLLTLLTTYQGHVPQGAPTSSSLAILTISKMCQKLEAYCNRFNIIWSVWIDDIIISAKSKKLLLLHKSKIDSIIKSIPFRINKDKETGIISSRCNNQASITGVYLTPNGRITIGKYKKIIKKRLIRAKKPNNSLLGSLMYLKRIDYHSGNKLVNQYKEKFGK